LPVRFSVIFFFFNNIVFVYFFFLSVLLLSLPFLIFLSHSLSFLSLLLPLPLFLSLSVSFSVFLQKPPHPRSGGALILWTSIPVYIAYPRAKKFDLATCILLVEGDAGV
jgi:hypothetical protein